MDTNRERSSGWGCFGLLLIIIVIAVVVKSGSAVIERISYSINETSVEEQAKIILAFERSTYEIDNTVSELGKEVANEIQQMGQEGYSFNSGLFSRASEEYLLAGQQYDDIVIPKGLSYKRGKKLEEIHEKFSDVYTFKVSAMHYMIKYNAEGGTENLNMVTFSSESAQNSMLEAISELVLLKKELGVGDEVITVD